MSCWREMMMSWPIGPETEDDDFFLPPDAASPYLRWQRLGNWVTNQSYDQAAVSTFFQKADYYLVAQAYAGQQYHCYT